MRSVVHLHRERQRLDARCVASGKLALALSQHLDRDELARQINNERERERERERGELIMI